MTGTGKRNERGWKDAGWEAGRGVEWKTTSGGQ